MRTLIAGILESAGHRIVEADDGADGLAKFAADPPDLVITDMVMPGKEGIETILELREINNDLPIIAISGSFTGSPVYLQAAARLGATVTLQKPFDVDHLLAAVDQCLGSGA